MHHYGASLREIQQEWTLPQALEFGNMAVKARTQQRIITLNDTALAFAAIQSKEGNKAFQKLNSELGRELNG